MAGSPGAARAVGSAMKHNPDMKTIPCHRVVGSSGAMHGYAFSDGITSKVQLLKREDVHFIGQRVDLVSCRWQG